jgi:hypothetical protein
MSFKFTARNPYRDLLRNVRKIVVNNSSATEKYNQLKQLYSQLKPKLLENERYLNSQAAFAQRCVHWNQTDVTSIKPVSNLKNPWLRFKREFEQALHAEQSNEQKLVYITTALAWFYVDDNKEDWIVD